jgi:hypothetical protein
VIAAADGYRFSMVRRIREEIIDDRDVDYVPADRGRRVVERRGGAAYGPGFGMNPLAWVIAAVLVVFILVMAFGGGLR